MPRPHLLARAIARRPLPLIAIAAVLTTAAIVPASHLRIRADIEALLPASSPAANGFRAFLDTFGGIEKVFVMIRLPDGAAPDPDRLADAAESLARTLAASPEVKRARWGLDEDDERFFTEILAPRLPLLLGDDAPRILASRVAPAGLAERAAAIKDAADGPGAIFLSRLVAADPLGLAEERLRALASGGALPFDPVTGALLAKDGRAALVIVTPTRSEADAAGGWALLAALDAAYAAVRREAGQDLRFEALGGPLYAAHGEHALKGDLIRIFGFASILVLLMIILAFDGPSIPSMSMAAVAIGQLWCAALIAAFYGPVTAVGVGFAAILLGLGDDFTIHFGARVREMWLSGDTAEDAVEKAVVETGPGILSAALTTAAAFGVLGFASFRPLRELGIVTALGVVLLLAATVLGAGPLLTLIARRWKKRSERPPWRGFGAIVTWGIGVGTRAPRSSLAIALVLTVVGALGATRLTLDTDLRRLRPTDNPAAAAERDLVRDFGVGLDTSTVTLRGSTQDEALDRADAVARLLRSDLPGNADVSSPSDWIVGGERLSRRLAALAPLRLDRAADRLAAALDSEGLRPEAFAASLDGLRAIGTGREPAPVPMAAWPDWLSDSIHVDERGAAVAVRARTPQGVWPSGPPETVLAAIERAAPGAVVANAPRLGAELRALAVGDLKRLGALAVAVVFAIVLVSYRFDFGATALTFVPVALGTVWTAGLWGLLGRRLDLFTISVLPVMVGIGVDDGLHVLHLARRRGEDLTRAAHEAGRGVVLTNLTTCAGFLALVLSHVPALRNGGLLMCVGNLLCLIATLVVLPAIDRLRASRGPS